MKKLFFLLVPVLVGFVDIPHFNTQAIPRGHGWYCFGGRNHYSHCERTRSFCNHAGIVMGINGFSSTSCQYQSVAVCMTYENIHQRYDKISCQASLLSCESVRRNMRRQSYFNSISNCETAR